MIHLDTHVVVWLAAGDLDRFSDQAQDLLERESLLVSPTVSLELTLLHEIGRISIRAAPLLDGLRRSIGLGIDREDFADVTARAADPAFGFTRDPFDRLIAAHADLVGTSLLTKDRTLRKHLEFAVWP